MLNRQLRAFWFVQILTLVVSLGGARTVAAQPAYTFAKVADATQVTNIALAGCFAINNQATVVFITSDGSVWQGNGSTLTQLATAGPAGQPVTTSCPGLNDAGDVAYAFAAPAYSALLKQSTGTVSELARSDVSPFFAASGSVGVHSLTNGGASVIAGANGTLYLVPSATPVFTPGPSDPPLSSMLSGTMNNNQVVAFVATRILQGVTRAGVYRSSGTPLVEDGNAVVPVVLSARPVVNDNNVVAFLGRLNDGTTHVLSTSDGVSFIDHSGALASDQSQTFSINSSRVVAFVAPVANGQFGLFVGPNGANDKVIAPGDPLDGSTVVNVRLAQESLNNAGQLAFWAELADGRSGVFVASPLQTPVASNTSIATIINTPANGTLPGSDPVGRPLTFSIAANGTKGIATITNAATGAFTYTPASNAIGNDSFTFQVTNGYLTSNVATVSVSISAGTTINHAPIAVAAGSSPSKSVRFNAATDELYRLTNLPSITSFTMMGWFRFVVHDHTYESFMRFGSNTNSRSFNLEMCCSATGWDGLYLWTGGNIYQVVPKMIAGTWYHLAVTVEGTGANQVKVYVNGGAPVQFPGVANNESGRFSMGTTHDSEYLNGNGAAVKLYDVPLTRAEIQQEMNQFAPVRTTNLNAFYPLQSADTATLDYSGNDRNLTQLGVLDTETAGPPITAGTPLVVSEDTQLSGTLDASDPDGNPLTYSIVSNGTKGTVVITNPATGAYIYTPNANVTGSDVFSFKVNDGLLDSNVAQMAITIVAVNDPPVAINGTATVLAGQSVSGTLQATDIDSNGLTYSIVGNGTKGTAVITNATTGAFTYTASASAGGTDTFTFRANDGGLNSNTATVTVTITPAPTASNGTLAATEDLAASGTLVANDPNGRPLTYSIVANGAKGTATLTNATTGAYVYTPLANMNGSDSFTFRATNGTQVTNTATVLVTIASVNDAPVAVNGSASVQAGSSVSGTLVATDIDNTSRTYSIVSNGTKGTATVTNAATGAFTYTALLAATGTDTFTFRANDGSLNSNIATVTVTITAVATQNHPPIAIPLGSSPSTSIRFDALTDELSRSTSTPPITSFTMMGWFRWLGDNHTYSTFLRLGHSSNSSGYALQMCCGNGWDDLYIWTGTGGNLYQVVRKMTQGAWYHVAMTVEGTGANQVKVYVNGGAPLLFPGNAGVPSERLWIGNSPSGSWLDGGAADVKIYNAVLTGAEIQQEMNQFAPVRTADLNSFYPLQDAATATLDAGGNNLSLTPKGTLTTDPSGPPLQAGTPLGTPVNTPLTGTLQATDQDGDPLTFSLASAPANGVVIVNPNGTFTYTPNAGYVGLDVFTFSVTDGFASSTATVKISVGP